MKRTEKLSTQKRLAVAASIPCFIATAIITPLTWSTIVAVDLKSADPLWTAELYPVITTASAIAGTVFLFNITPKMGRRPFISSIFLIFLGLGFPIITYAYSKASIFDIVLVSALPTLGIAAAVFAAVAHRRPDRQSADADAPSVVGAGSATLSEPG